MIGHQHKKIFFSLSFFIISLILTFALTKAFEALAVNLQLRSLLVNDKGNGGGENNAVYYGVEDGPLLGVATYPELSTVDFIDEEQKHNIYFNIPAQTSDTADKKGSGDKPVTPVYVLDNLGDRGGFKGEKSWAIVNKSNEPKFLYVGLENVVNLENNCNDQEKAVQADCDQADKEGDLGKIIYLSVFLDGKYLLGSNLDKNQENKIALDWASLPGVVIRPKETRVVTVSWDINEAMYDNKVQSDSVQFELSFSLEKKAKNSKSLDRMIGSLDQEPERLDDMDSDGLSDYEEKNVYFTNPLNQDTDGDGYPDGLEVTNGYDPLKKVNKKL